MQEHGISGLPLTQITQVFLENKKTQVVGIESFWGEGKQSECFQSISFIYTYTSFTHTIKRLPYP